MASTFKSFLIERILKENSDSAYVSDSPEEKIITEPEENPGESKETQELPNIYEMYHGLSDIDITCPCVIAEFFSSLCEHVNDDIDDIKDGEDPDEIDDDEINITLKSDDEFGSY